jgi:hypothetical protein
MSRFRFSRQLLVATGVCALLLGAATVQAQQYDDPQPYDQSQAYDNSDQAPGRVARLAYLSGQVQFAPAGESDWGSVEVNRPMVIGDRLLTGGDGRAVLELGDALVRIDNNSAFDFLNLAQDNVQIELSQGTLNLAVRQLAQGANFEVDTPTVAFVASTPGIYRIDDDPSGTGSMVTVFQGSGTVYGENGVSRQVAAGTSYRFNDSTLASVDANGLPQPDDFDRFCEARDANYNRYAQQEQQYVPPDMIGGGDLDQYGQWNDVPEYGNVWYPTSVPAGWAPYRDGHWAWIDPWGWTWVDDQPWGFAPFHYGRWVYARNRWGWMPGQVDVRPEYAPALVAFIGGAGFSLSANLGGGPVGWFPLGPRDVYMPWFRASRNYFTNVNVTNIRNVYVNRTVINNFYGDYQAGRAPPRGGHDYAYRRMQGAVTAVPRNVFTGARPVHPAALKLNRNQLERSEVALRPGVNPGRSSLGLRNPTVRPAAIKGGREPFARPVVARHQPPPRPVDFAARQKVIASQHGQPLTTAQMQDLRKSRPAPANDRVKLVPAIAGAAAGAAAIGALHRTTPPRPAEPAARTQPARPVVAPRAGEPPARRAGPTEPFKNTVHPIQAPVNPVRNAPQRPNELPSARFAHPGEPATLPRAPVIRPAGESQRNAPASGRLPVARPVERAPQQVDNRAVQQQRQAEAGVQQRALEQQAQQQRQAQTQAQQRARDQQMQQQRQAQTQAQQRARDQQMQQQRQAQMQTQQRARDQQAQQQRQAQMQAQQRARDQQAQQQRQAQMQEQQVQQQRAVQMQQQQQREMQMQRQQQVQQREVQRAPQPHGRPAPERREPPPVKHPPESSGH